MAQWADVLDIAGDTLPGRCRCRFRPTVAEIVVAANGIGVTSKSTPGRFSVGSNLFCIDFA